MDNDEGDILNLCKMYILDGESLLHKLADEKYNNIKGINKLQVKIKKEVIFLSQVLERKQVKKEHLVCNNLHFYKALIHELDRHSHCKSVLETFSYEIDGQQKKLTVDIVSSEGQRWTKIIARNPAALHQVYREGENFGRRSILDQATSYLSASAQNCHLYQQPQITFNFINGVPEEMKNFFENLGIVVEGKTSFVDDQNQSCEDSTDDSAHCSSPCGVDTLLSFDNGNVSKLNLCVTTMIAYVSALTNGSCNSTFREPLLNEQAEWERLRPVKPLLDCIFKDKDLISCCSAVEDFKSIVAVVGGTEEKSRAANLLSKIRVVPDVIFDYLKPSGKVKKRSLSIFGTGYAHKAITVTANKGFVLAAKQKGVNFAVVIHESRALTESKQLPDIT